MTTKLFPRLRAVDTDEDYEAVAHEALINEGLSVDMSESLALFPLQAAALERLAGLLDEKVVLTVCECAHDPQLSLCWNCRASTALYDLGWTPPDYASEGESDA